MTSDRPDWVYHRADDPRAVVRQLGDGLETNVFPGENSMLSFVMIDPHSDGQLHSHPEEQWGILLEGECVRIQAGMEVPMAVGDFWHTPGGVEHGIRTGDRGALVLDVFSPPRPAYRNEGAGFGDI